SMTAVYGCGRAAVRRIRPKMSTKGREKRPGERRRLLMVGGAGRMGRRLCRFFRARGHAVAVLDPAGAPTGIARGSLRDAGTADVVVVAASLSRAAEAEEAAL